MPLNSSKKSIQDLLLTQPTQQDIAAFKFYKSRPDIAAMEILNQDLAPFQRLITKGLHSHSYVINALARGSGKTRMIGTNAALFAMLNPKMKIGFFAPGFRTAKYSFLEFEAIVNESPYLEESIKKISKQTDMWTAEFKNGSMVFALPLAADNPMSVRGTRVHVAMLDEYPHIRKDVLDAVINPMLATQRNPMENVRRIEREKKAIAEGKKIVRKESAKNKVLGFSSAYYKFNHMWENICKYRELRKQQIKEKGKSDYAVYVFSYKDAPEGFFDTDFIKHAEATTPSIVFRMEYLSEFPDDSEGFYKRSLIDSCMSDFSLELKGEKGARYFIGIDPARASDHFSIYVLKMVGDQMKLVAMYSFFQTPFHTIAQFVRKLTHDFNVEQIGIDSGGGGLPFKDALANPSTAEGVKDILLDFEDDDNIGKQGRRIIKMINFSTGWITDANYDMRASMEHKKLLIPMIHEGSTFIKPEVDTEDALDTMRVEYLAMIKELQSIVTTATKTGLLHFDSENPNMRKDRYSALLVAHRVASDFIKQGFQKKELAVGGWIGKSGEIVSPAETDDYAWDGPARVIDEIKLAQQQYLNPQDGGALSKD